MILIFWKVNKNVSASIFNYCITWVSSSYLLTEASAFPICCDESCGCVLLVGGGGGPAISAPLTVGDVVVYVDEDGGPGT